MRAMILGSTALLTSLLLPSLLAAEDYIIDIPVTTTNGGNTLADGDTITVTETGSVAVTGSDFAYGLEGRSSNITLTNNGTVTAVATGLLNIAYGLNALGSNNTLTNTGTVRTTSLRAVGLRADGSENTLTNIGTVEAIGETLAFGLIAAGSDNTLTNSGTVTVEASATGSPVFAYGLYTGDGNTNILTNSGTVIATATNGNAYGFLSFGDFNTLINSGTVEADGLFAGGLYASGSDNTLTNSGKVTATSTSTAIGLYARGSDNTLTNSGTVTATGNGATGLFAQAGNTNILTNSGTVTATAFNGLASGATISGNTNTLNNSGTMRATGTSVAYGVQAIGSDNTLTNSGTVTATSSSSAYGLYARSGSFNTLTNSGTLTATGELAHGLYAIGSDNALTNSGIVTATANDSREAYGLSTIGSDNTLTNNGTVTAIGGTAYSIYMSGSGATLNLLEGSVLQGDVFFGNTDATLNFGLGLNAAVNTSISSEIPTTITTQGGASVVSGTVIYAVDSTGFVAGDQTVGVVGGMALDALARQQADSPRVQVSQGTVAPQGWAQVFGGYRSRDGDDSTVEFTGYSFGAMAGKELSGGHGFFIGGAHSRDESDSSFENRSNTVFGGYYTAYDIGTVAVDASLTFGVAQNDNERTVANNMVEGGIETAKAEYNSYFLMPSATFRGDWAIASGTLTPSLRLRYAGVYHDAYTETGSAANMDVDSRVSHLAEARLQLERGLPDLATPGGTLMTDVRFGVDAQYFTGDDVSSTLAGQSLVFTPEDDDVAGRAFVGLDMRHIADDGGWDLRGGVELGHSNTGTTDVSATVRWSVNF